MFFQVKMVLCLKKWIIDLTTQISTQVFSPQDNHHTSECYRSGLCVIPILSHKIKNKYLKFNEISHFTASPRTFLSETGIFLYNELVVVENTTANNSIFGDFVYLFVCLFYRSSYNTTVHSIESAKIWTCPTSEGLHPPCPQKPLPHPQDDLPYPETWLTFLSVP